MLVKCSLECQSIESPVKIPRMIGFQKSKAQNMRNIPQTDVSLKTGRFGQLSVFSNEPSENNTMTHWYQKFLDDGRSRNTLTYHYHLLC